MRVGEKLLDEILIERGKTLTIEVQWCVDPLIYIPITGIDLSYGAPRLNVPSHPVPNGWYGAVTRVGGMRQINAANSPPRGSDYKKLTVIDTNTVEMNEVDATGFSAYTSGGFLQIKTPQDLSGYTAAIQMRDKRGGTLLASSKVSDAPKNIISATVSNTTKKITLSISATDSAAITFDKAVAELELTSPGGVVSKLRITDFGAKEDADPVRVAGEITT